MQTGAIGGEQRRELIGHFDQKNYRGTLLDQLIGFELPIFPVCA